MAEANSSNSKIGILAKAQKQLSRTKTKVLQNLGKAEKTTDDQFKDYVLKTDKQLEAALHLQKELKNYAHCVRDLSQASKSLQNAFMDIYEPEWTSESTFKSQLQAFDLLWNDYLQNLQDTVTAPMHAYLHSFPVLKTKVAKRGRKMVDYDNCRHNLDVLLAAKKKDDSKIQKAQDELKEVKKIFDDLNNELHTELPDFYNSRVTFYADLFSRFFGAEHRLHSEVGKTCESLTDIAQALGKDFEQFKYVPKRPLSVSESTINGDISSASSPPTPIPSTSSSVTHSAVKEPMYTNQEQSNQQQLKRGSSGGQVNGRGSKHDFSSPAPKEMQGTDANRPASAASRPVSAVRSSLANTPNVEREPKDDSDGDDDSDDSDKNNSMTASRENNVYEDPIDTGSKGGKEAPSNHVTDVHSDDSDDDDDEEEEGDYTQVPANHPVVSHPADTIFVVQATHKYTGEDMDELSFEAGEIIFVVPFENPDEQDDGWQMGIKQSDGVKGVFPENFTQRV
ncbi:unnamed protein product [Lymnaea stagnalis]|uniref:Amphiphysin n=1 Tax=Lymnaea stagnalis TaxID=6523 RepID=A0AAV2HVN0_LYMST